MIPPDRLVITPRHKTPNGEPIVCHLCQMGQHELCITDSTEHSPVRCHCRECFKSPCELCYPAKEENRAGTSCPTCFTQMPLTNVCEYC